MLKLSDFWLWTSVGALILIGLLAIFSSTHTPQIKLGLDPFLFVKRQFLSVIVGIIGLSAFAYLDYQHLKKAAPYFYGLMLLLLIIVLFSGSTSSGAQRWFQIGYFSFQPSEVSKIIMAICLAAFFAERKKMDLWDSSALVIMVSLPFLLIFKQPDLGTALVFIFILIGLLTASWSSPKLLILLVTPMVSILLRPLIYIWLLYLIALVIALFLSRASFWDWVMILGLNIGVGIALPFIWGTLKAYQRIRILSFLNPASDPYGSGYHSLQSMLAIGSGGFFGKGFLHGTQTQLQFIPEQHSDFIFSAIGEEFGFIGAVVTLALFGIIVWRALTIAAEAPDIFSNLLAVGIGAMTTFHLFANMGMTLGLLPVVGIPLPFVSYGGSSLLMNLIAVGILQSIAMRRQKIIF
jgi:rod shape determining protein RodA